MMIFTCGAKGVKKVPSPDKLNGSSNSCKPISPKREESLKVKNESIKKKEVVPVVHASIANVAPKYPKSQPSGAKADQDKSIQPGNDSRPRQPSSDKKYGDTINDDTLNDTDCDWGAAEVVYNADRSKKKKKQKS